MNALKIAVFQMPYNEISRFNSRRKIKSPERFKRFIIKLLSRAAP